MCGGGDNGSRQPSDQHRQTVNFRVREETLSKEQKEVTEEDTQSQLLASTQARKHEYIQWACTHTTHTHTIVKVEARHINLYLGCSVGGAGSLCHLPEGLTEE